MRCNMRRRDCKHSAAIAAVRAMGWKFAVLNGSCGCNERFESQGSVDHESISARNTLNGKAHLVVDVALSVGNSAHVVVHLSPDVLHLALKAGR